MKSNISSQKASSDHQAASAASGMVRIWRLERYFALAGFAASGFACGAAASGLPCCTAALRS